MSDDLYDDFMMEIIHVFTVLTKNSYLCYSPQPFFFHHKGQDLDSAGQNKAADQVIYQF